MTCFNVLWVINKSISYVEFQSSQTERSHKRDGPLAKTYKKKQPLPRPFLMKQAGQLDL